MEAIKLLSIGWQNAVREWVYRVRPELTDEFVRFFGFAFKPISYREQAWFGVHPTRISLCVGNIWLAAFSKQTNQIWLLVDEAVRSHRFDLELAKSTERYMPLLRFPVLREYNGREIAERISPFLKNRVSMQLPQTPAPSTIIQNNAAPLCPKCNIPMVIRTVVQGEHKGKQFYGCPNFPKCREVRPITTRKAG